MTARPLELIADEPEPDDAPAETPDIQAHPHVIAANQVVEALEDVDRDPAEYLRWPFPALHQLTGALGAGGALWFVCAYSGAGKTTFVASCIDEWQRAGKRVYVMPLETVPKAFRTYLACMQLEISPGDALSGRLRELPNGDGMRSALKRALLDQTHTPYVDRVMVSPIPAVSLADLKRAVSQARDFEADIVIVDHIDHVEGGAGTPLYQAAKEVNHAALKLAQEHGMLVLCTSQLNTQTVMGHDHLARYQPPRDQHVVFGNLKRQVASGMIGLFRPIRNRLPLESPEEYLAALKKARSGESEPGGMLDPYSMGVVAMKLRHFGGREGARTYLGFRHGRVYSPNAHDLPDDGMRYGP